jgi:thiamine-monophosphate kinase
MADAGHDEFALIDRIVARLGDAAATDILVPPGDDSAAWIPGGGAVVASTDAIAEGTHWRPHLLSMADVGWRAVAQSVSDIAAMGATPQVVLVAAMLGPSVTLRELDDLIDGLADGCRAHNVRVAGGDIVRGRNTALGMTAIGAARLDRASRAIVMRRDMAQVGDAVAVSGHPGAAGAGRRLLEQSINGVMAAQAIGAFRRPQARIDLGLAAVNLGVHCAIDVSDGLVQDLCHIAKRSAVGIEVDVEALPLAPSAVSLLGSEAARGLALAGGEDYELALVGRQAALEALEGVTVIGRVLDQHPGEVIVRKVDGAPYPVPEGWDALRLWPLRETPAAQPVSSS